MYQPLLRGDERLAELLARRDIAPCTDHLDRFAPCIPDHLQFVADPAIAAVLLTEAIFAAEAVLLEETRIGPEDARTILGMDATLPKVRAVEVLLAVVPEQLLDVLAYECRRVIAGCFEAVDHSR